MHKIGYLKQAGGLYTSNKTVLSEELVSYAMYQLVNQHIEKLILGREQFHVLLIFAFP